MTVYQNMNQFAQGPIKGDVSAIPSPNVISCQITTTSSNTLKAGSAVKLVAGTAYTILVDKSAATEQQIGFVVFNPKKDSFTAGDQIEVALAECVMWMEAGAAFNRGQNVEQVSTGDKVIAYAGVNTAVGVALDTASASGDLVRILIRNAIEFSSSSSSSSCRSSSSSSSSSAT